MVVSWLFYPITPGGEVVVTTVFCGAPENFDLYSSVILKTWISTGKICENEGLTMFRSGSLQIVINWDGVHLNELEDGNYQNDDLKWKRTLEKMRLWKSTSYLETEHCIVCLES